MTYIVISNDIMGKRESSKKSVQAGRKGTIKIPSPVEEPDVTYRSFKVTHGGRQKRYDLRTGYGYFILSVRNAETLAQIILLVEAGIPAKEIAPVIEYLGMNVPDVAKAASVSPSTVSRWKPDTSIGAPGSSQFFRIDEVIRKGVDVFGGPDELRGWLHRPNLALGNEAPAKFLTSQIGVQLVDEALDALHYGNVM